MGGLVMFIWMPFFEFSCDLRIYSNFAACLALCLTDSS